jgi:Zn-dependent alcohol dehydrogenase
VQAGNQGDAGVAAVAGLLGFQGGDPAALLLVEAVQQDIEPVMVFALGVVVAAQASGALALMDRGAVHDKVSVGVSRAGKTHCTENLEVIHLCPLYLVGVARPDVEIALNIASAIGGQQRVQGVNFGSTNFKRDIPMYAELYLQGRMNLDDLVSKRIALRDVNDGYAALKDGSLTRVVVTSF